MHQQIYKSSEGSTAFLNCTFQLTADNIEWKRAKKNPSSITKIFIDNIKYFSTLVIANTEKAADEDYYQCAANNNAVNGDVVELEVCNNETNVKRVALLANDITHSSQEGYSGLRHKHASADQGCEISFVVKIYMDTTQNSVLTPVLNGMKTAFQMCTGCGTRIGNTQAKQECILVCMDITAAEGPLEPSSIHLAEQFKNYLSHGGIVQTSDESRTVLDIDINSFKIKPKNADHNGSPFVSISYGEFRVPVGESAIIKTNVIAEPAAIAIEWFRIEKDMKFKIEIDNEQYFGSSDISPTLIIRGASIGDQGHYLCQAANKNGVGSSNITFLSIQSDTEHHSGDTATEEALTPQSCDLPGHHKDVHKGYFRQRKYDTLPSTAFHHSLKMGCSIGGLLNPTSCTLGPFVKFDNKIGFLTCAHALFDIGSTFQDIDYQYDGIDAIQIIQPACDSPIFNRPPCGHVRRAIFKPQLITSIDVAVIEITDPSRIPVSGQFTNTRHSSYINAGFEELPEFNSGLVERDVQGLDIGHPLYMFGSSSDITRGVLHTYGVSLASGATAMNNQCVFRSTYPTKTPFAMDDSGSGVFTIYPGTDELVCIGMAIGITSYADVVVTPIGAILEALGPQYSIASFP
ncbi:uncharacterized protein LOC117321117 [Pecten maximus]|uniref:uncharacterized protein LOC117321117 n=1 Tax=Pecten maximus TaxID=6579 RepID=UPI001458DB17|nr:uncharacterized protein LOC117321117 [Pecten maximus]